MSKKRAVCLYLTDDVVGWLDAQNVEVGERDPGAHTSRSDVARRLLTRLMLDSRGQS